MDFETQPGDAADTGNLEGRSSERNVAAAGIELSSAEFEQLSSR